MPKATTKEIIINQICTRALGKLENLTNDDDRVDDIFDEAFDEVCNLMEFRYHYPRTKVIKSKDWWDKILPNCEDSVFMDELRVTRQNFHKILALIKDDKGFTNKQTDVELQLAVTLSRFGEYGSASTWMKKASRFGVGEGTIQSVTARVIDAILSLEDQYITWPTVEDREKICDHMKDKLPNCIGYVAGTSIKLAESPLDEPKAYLTPKKIYAIQAQAVVDNDRKIRDLNVGFPGSIDLARVFAASKFCQNPNQYFSKDQYIVGNASYPCTEILISAPRRNTSSLSESDKKAFIKRFSRHRVTADNTFALLKEIFKSLHGLRIRVSKNKGHADAIKWITTCCIIYNILMPDPKEYGLVLKEEDDYEDDPDSEIHDETYDSQMGLERRMRLVHWVLGNQ